MQDNLLSYSDMPVNKQTELGKINITNQAIASLVADASMECYGVVGLANKNYSEKSPVVLNSDDLEKGIVVKNNKSNIDISLYIVVASGIKVTEVLRNVQQKVKYVVSKQLEISVGKVNVYVQDLKKVD